MTKSTNKLPAVEQIYSCKVTELLYSLGIDPVKNIMNKTICRILEINVPVITVLSFILPPPLRVCSGNQGGVGMWLLN